ncbi:MAG: TonB-dependent receptor [Bacteroidetes bacterium]|nr:TonB-dependent receptor [Bacteroidota bacterium]
MKKILVLILFLSCSLNLYAIDHPSDNNGVIEGRVIDAETQSAVPDAVIKILNTDYKTGSGAEGYFRFEELKYGTYLLEVSATGYKTKVKTDVVISSANPVQVTVEISQTNFMTEKIEVGAEYFDKNSDVNLSAINLDYEEIRRSPGSAEDISRMLQTAPGVSLLNDQRNDLIVRGGSPTENLVMIDGVEIPNINHYGSQGTTGGAITFINAKFIREADILTGGFNARYGDRLSSIVDIKFRDGSFSKHIYNANLSFAGFGGTFEGPVSSKMSYLLSINRSYLDPLKSSLRLTAVPNYWDFNAKLTYKLNENNIFNFIGFTALDKINFKVDENTTVDDFPYDSDNKTNAYTGGLTYKHLYKDGYIQTVLSNTHTTYYSDNVYVPTGKHDYFLDNYENEMNFRVDLNHRLSKNFFISLTAGTKWGQYRNNFYAVADTTPEGYITKELKADNTINDNKLFAGLNLTNKLFGERLVLNYGIRFDYFDYIRLKANVSPRAGASFYITPYTVVNAAYGIYYQAPQNIWLASDPANRNLNSIRCEHYIAGIEQMITKDIKAVFEIYHKIYKDYPVSINDPSYILIDGGADFGPNLVGPATSYGRGYVKGIDISIQKKLTGNGIYGSINYSNSLSGFTAIEGGEKLAAFDPKNQFTVIVGYQVADDWLIGVKFKYAGGRPYTPFNYELSKQLGRGVYDMSRFNEEHYPDYHRLDIRVDKKFYFKRSSITTYFELQNAYNRQNVYGYFWNKAKNDKGTVYQWAFMPVGGFNLEF